MKAARWEIKGFLTAPACKSLIDMAERNGFEQATLDTQIGIQTRIEYRNNKRFTFDDRVLSSILWTHLKDDQRLNNPGWEVVGLNNRFRIYKYSDPSEFFASHYDGRYLKVPEYEESWVTMLVYLNDDFEGGETSFQDGDIKPEIGMAALMTQANYLHEAVPVIKGTKYVLRTDIMYRKVV